MSSDVFRTGVHSLDRALGGGVPSGSVAVALGDATSAVELLGYRTAVATERDTRYLTTMRTPATVRAAIDDAASAGRTLGDLGPSHSETVDIRQVGATETAGGFQPALDAFDTVVVDSFRDIVVTGGWRELFADIRSHVRERDGLALFVLDADPDKSLERPLRQVCRAADAVFEYRTDRATEDTLTARKVRGLAAEEPVLPVTVSLEVGRTLYHDPDRGHE
ncbi:MAG: hypothetical protein U5K28_01735 [Halobacteriales archaeon]|nr:hypothetical protein [Halobacteriales archaeon]